MTTTLILHTILALLLLILPLGALYLLDRPSMKPFATALTKGFIQLLIFSLIVWAVYKVDNIWLSIGWLLVMAVWAGFLVITKCKLTILQYLFPASTGLFGGTLLVGLWLLVAVLPIDHISARWFLPVMAVLLGHSASMLVRGINNFVTMLQRNRGQYDFLLGNGASQWQALMPFIRTSLLAILSPTIANLSALALVSLPLLFCGMLLGGFAPINAFAMMLYAVLGCIASSVLALGITLLIIKYMNLLS
ncbi:MAG: ABC transporter permease [Prevotella ruminicola]|jgi:putative ABC transport system permease protein|uniref:ABC transporter permease n=1 Tax=Xylanibacter ruminicola TaxID=839 RepID=A0A9D5P0Y5_XYLRU|nr:ABC transporter permease [Xylanibacter ruminicola]